MTNRLSWNRSRSLFALAVILTAAAILRFWNLGGKALWLDELSSWRRSSFSTVGEVIGLGAGPDVHPPGYYIVLHHTIELFGDSETVLRLPSAIAGFIAVPLIYFVGQRLYSDKVGLIAAALLAVSGAAVLHSQNARAYSFLLIAACLTSYFWLALVRRIEAGAPTPIGLAVGYVISAIFAAYFHYFGLQFVALQGLGAIALFAAKPRLLGRWAAIYAAVALAYAPWIPSMIDQFGQNNEFWIKSPELFASLKAQARFSFHVPRWAKIIIILPIYLYGMYLAARFVVHHCKAKSLPRHILLQPDALLVYLWLTPSAAAYIQSIVSTPVLTSRNLITTLPAIYLLLARCISSVRIPYSSVAITSIISGFILHHLIFYSEFYSRPSQNAYRDIAEFVLEREDGLPIAAATWSPKYFNFYFDRLGSSRGVSIVAVNTNDIDKFGAFTEKTSPAGFWFLVGQRGVDPALMQTLRDRFRVKEDKAIRGFRAILFMSRD